MEAVSVYQMGLSKVSQVGHMTTILKECLTTAINDRILSQIHEGNGHASMLSLLSLLSTLTGGSMDTDLEG